MPLIPVFLSTDNEPSRVTLSQSPIISKGIPTSISPHHKGNRRFLRRVSIWFYVSRKEDRYKTLKNGQTVKQNKTYNPLITLLEIVHKTRFLEMSKIGEEC